MLVSRLKPPSSDAFCEQLCAQTLVEYDSITQTMAGFLRACVLARLNIVIPGGTGFGKTTLLNVFSGFIPEN